MKKKVIFVVIDGLGDRPNKKLKNKTPLEAAHTPNLDFLAKNSRTGLVYPVDKKIAPESDIAIMALLGYDPKKYSTNRGPLEAYGMGLDFKEGYLALRANFATVKDGRIVDRRVGRTLTTEEGEKLTDELNSKLKETKSPFLQHPAFFKFSHSTEHRGVLIVKGKFSDKITNVDPAYKKVKNLTNASRQRKFFLQEAEALDNNLLSKYSADVVNDFVHESYEILSKSKINQLRKKKRLLPANVVLLRDAGIKLPHFKTKLSNWAAIVGMPMEIGLCKLAGMKILSYKYPEIKSKDVYKHLYESLETSMRYCDLYLKKYWNSYSGFYIHIKETDNAGHDSKPLEKKKMIELIDKELISKLPRDAIICVTCDHSTPCNLGVHSSDPIPLMIYGKGKDKTTKFSEKECRKGSLKIKYSKDIMKFLK